MRSLDPGVMFRCPALALFCAIQFFAQSSTAQEKATVEGTITNSITGGPVLRARISVEGSVDERQGRYSAVTGADGSFSISRVAPGQYRILVQRTGFVMTGKTPRYLTLAAGETRRLDLQLTPAGAVTGRVTDENGVPVENASVSTEGSSRGQSAVTDLNGAFRIGGLRPGRYRINVSENNPYGGPPEIRTDGTTDVHYASTYYPGVLSTKEAGFVPVRPGSETSGIEIRLVRVPFVRVSGKTVGIPSNAGNRMIMLEQGDGGWAVPPRRDGSFEFWRLDPGKYRLNAEWDAPDGSQVHTATVNFEVAGSNVDNILLRVVPDSDISGQLEYENDAAKQAASAEKSPLNISLLHSDGGDSEAAAAQADKTGAFHFRKVPAEKYKITLLARAVYLRAIRLGPTETEGSNP
jgi:hypothetical protein